MTTPQYYLAPTQTASNNNDFIAALQSIIASALEKVVPGGGTFVKIAMGALASSATQLAFDEANVVFKYTEDNSEIQIGDKLYSVDIHREL